MVKGDYESVPYQKNGLYVSWLRHNAYICLANFPSIDLVIPMAFRNCVPYRDIVNPEYMSHIVISVKNCEDSEGIRMDILPKDVVEGVIVLNENNDKKRKLYDPFYSWCP